MICIIHESGNMNGWGKILSTVELVINSLPNKSTGFIPFYLNYGHDPILPIQLVKGNEDMQTDSVSSFVRRVSSDWEIAKENLHRAIGQQQKNYRRRHRNAQYAMGDLVLPSTRNLRMNGFPDKLKKRFIGSFKIQEGIGQQAYRLLLPETWKVDPVFHI